MRRTSPSLVLLLAMVAALTGCTRPSMMDPSEMMMRADTRERFSPDAALSESLFKEDQAALSNEDLQRILAAKVTVPERAKLAVVRYGRLPYWWGWSEDFVRLNEEIDSNFLGTLRGSGRLREVAYLPSLVTPNLMTLPYLRQSAARCQADLVLVYRTSTRTYAKQKWFAADRTRAYCTVEAVVLDTRTGLIPFSTVVNEYFSASKTKGELDFAETVAKAEQKAIGQAWQRVARETVAYLEGQAGAAAANAVARTP